MTLKLASAIIVIGLLRPSCSKIYLPKIFIILFMKSKTVLIVRSGYPSKAFTLARLKELGYTIGVIDPDESCPNHLFDFRIITNTNNIEESITDVQRYIRDYNLKVDGVLTFWDEAVVLTAELGKVFDTPHINTDIVRIIKNKHNFREFCKEHDLPTVNSVIINNEKDIETFSLRFPVVLKPASGAASAFVIKVNNQKELRDQFSFIQNNIKSFWLAKEWSDFSIVAEEYIDGREVDIDLLVQNSDIKFYSITDNFKTHEPYFIEVGQQMPSSLTNNIQNELLVMVRKVITKFKIENACIHFEAKYGTFGPVPIEINLRMGGDEVYSFLKAVWDIDFIEESAKIACDVNINLVKKSAKQYLSGKYFLIQKTGKLKSISYPKYLKNSEYVKEVYITKNIGDQVTSPPKDFDYLGWITVTGTNSKQSIQNLNRIYRQFEFIID